MIKSEFDKILSERIRKIETVLRSKSGEYSHNGDILFTFKQASIVNEQSMSMALWGMLTKHLISVMDLVNGRAKATQNIVDEKIGDLINYLILLEAILKETKADTQSEAKSKTQNTGRDQWIERQMALR